MPNNSCNASLLIISSRIRQNILLAWITTGLITIILFTYKPPLSNSDLYSNSYDRNFTLDLVSKFKNNISNALKEHFDSLDHDWVPSANGFVSSTTIDDASDYLYEYLNIPGDRKPKHIDIVYSSSNEVTLLFNHYLEDRKNRWQAFEIPILSIRVARDEAAFYLTIVGMAVQIMMLAKLEHLRRIEKSNQDNYFIDPSLFSASPKNLTTFPRLFRVLIFILQSASRYLPPIANSILSGFFLDIVANWNKVDYTRIWTGFLFSIFASIISIIYFIRSLRPASDREYLFSK